jgi:hypothetical protein
VAERVRADPYIPPRRRDRQRPDPIESGRVGQRSPVDVKVGEPGAGGDSGNSGESRVGSVKQFAPRFAGRFPANPQSGRGRKIRTAAAILAIVDAGSTPVHFEIGATAAHLRQLGLSDRAIAPAIGVSDKTVAESLRAGGA